jgi:NAD(P)-dependent dehydrogenase (short-subunit alcohol dehydrogenase family)
MQLNSSVSAVVTGGASGLGLACVEALRQTGAKVAIFDMNEEKGAASARETGALFVKVDVSNEESVAAGFAKARAGQGQERILINCAGVGSALKTVSRDRETGAVKMHPLEIFERTININLTGTFRCVAHAAAGMMTLSPSPDGDKGAIVMTASVAAVDGQIGQAAYSASKGGVVGMTLPIARDLSSEGIRVNTILPGIFDTPLLAALPEKARESLGQQVPFPSRLGRPAEYAALALEMIRNGYFNGEHVRLDGAIRMAPR